MKRLLFLTAVLAAACLWAAPAKTQSVYVSASAQYDAGCNCAVASYTYYADIDAETYYDLTYSEELSTTSLDGSTNDVTSDQQQDLEIDNLLMGDTIAAAVWGDGEMYSQYIDPACGFGGAQCYCCSYGFGNTPPYCSSCPIGYPSDSMPIELNSENTASASGPTCGDTTEDSLIDEYQDPQAFGSTASGKLDWVPGCADLTTSNLTGYSNAFSGGDITNWLAAQQPFLNGLWLINNAKGASGVTGLPPQPLPEANDTDVIYRTPKENWTKNHAHPNEPHEFGLAIDLASNSGNWYTIAAWAEWSNGTDPSNPAARETCVEPTIYQQSSTAHVHVDWRPLETTEIPPGDQCSNNWVIAFPPGFNP